MARTLPADCCGWRRWHCRALLRLAERARARRRATRADNYGDKEEGEGKACPPHPPVAKARWPRRA